MLSYRLVLSLLPRVRLTEKTNGISISGSSSTISGGTITGQTNGIELLGGNLTVKGGTITGTTNDGILANGITSTDAITITNGTILGNNNGIELKNGTLTVNGGSITGSTISGIATDTAKLVTISGGTIKGNKYGIFASGNKLQVNGGNIQATECGIYINTDTATLKRGEVTGGTIGIKVHKGSLLISGGTYTGNNYGVYVASTCSSDGNFLKGGTFIANDNDGKAVYSEELKLKTILYTKNGTKTDYAYFNSDNTQINYGDTDTAITSPKTVSILPTSHKHGDQTYTLLSSVTNSTIGVAGEQTYVFLADDLDTSNGGNINIYGNVTICLNDATWNLGTKSFVVTANSSLTIEDCSGNGQINSTGNQTIYFNKEDGSQAFTLKSGTINCTTGIKAENHTTGSVNISIEGGTINATSRAVWITNSIANFKMSGGDISSNDIGITANGTSANSINLKIEGGSIVAKGGHTIVIGSGINSCGESLVMTGGTLKNTGVQKHVIYLNSGSYSVNIRGNSQLEAVGTAGVYTLYQETACDSEITITGGTFISNNGTIYSKSTKVGAIKISGGSFKGKNWGIYLTNKGPILSGGDFYGNSATIGSANTNTTPLVDMLATDSEREYFYYSDEEAKIQYDPNPTVRQVPNKYKVIYVRGKKISKNTDWSDLTRPAPITLVTSKGATPIDATVLLGSEGVIPAIATTTDGKKYQIAYFVVDETEHDPYSEGYKYQTADGTNKSIVAYAVNTVELYKGEAGEVKNLSRVFFVASDSTPKCNIKNSSATTNIDKYDENYGLSINSPFTSMADAGQAIKNMYGSDTYANMKDDTHAVILLGNDTYNLSDFEVNLSVENGESVTNGAFTYKKHYQSPSIYMSSDWMGNRNNSKLIFKATSNSAGYSERYYKGSEVLYAQANRSMLYNNLIIDKIEIHSNEGHLFVNGYSFTATENVTSNGSSGGSTRSGGIPTGYPNITVNGGTVANDDGQDKNFAGSFRTPEGPQANIAILSGKWGRVSGGSRSLASKSNTETQVTIGGTANVGTLVAASVEGNFEGNSYVNVKGSANVVYLIGSTLSWPLPSNEKNVRNGNTRIVIDGTPTIQEIYGGTLGRYTTNTFQNGNTSIIVNGGTITTLWGGSGAGQTNGNIEITVNGGAVTTLYGAGSSKSPMIEDVRAEGTAITYNGSVDNYGDKTVNGYNILNYNAEKQQVTGLGNTYGSVSINVAGGTVGTLYGGGMGYYYKGDSNYGDKLNYNFYNIAQVCNCSNHKACNNCDNIDDQITGINQDCSSCVDAGAAVTINITGGTITGDVFAGGSGSAANNRIGKICSSTTLKISGGAIGGYVYGGSKNAAISGNTNVIITGGTIAHDVYGAGETGVVVGDTNVIISGTAAIAEDVYGAGRESDTFGNVNIEINGQASMRNIFGGGRYGNVGTYDNGEYTGKGNIRINIDGSNGAIINSVISGGQCGKVGTVNVTVENFNSDQITGSIYCCGRSEWNKTPSNINGNMILTINNIALVGNDRDNNPKYVYIGGTLYGRIIKNIIINNTDSNVTFYNKYGVISDDDPNGIKKDFIMLIQDGGKKSDGSLVTFPGADEVEYNDSNGELILPNGTYVFSVGNDSDKATVRTYSLLLDTNGEKIAESVAAIEGGGKQLIGKRTLTTQLLTQGASTNLNFIGWYEKTDINRTVKLSSSTSWTVDILEDKEYVAVYQVADSVTANLTLINNNEGNNSTENKGTYTVVDNGKAEGSDGHTKTSDANSVKFEVNTGVTNVTCKYVQSGNETVYWYNSSGHVVGTGETYTATILGNTTLTAVTVKQTKDSQSSDYALVRFYSYYYQVVDNQSYNIGSNDQLMLPTIPDKVGYQARAWLFNGVEYIVGEDDAAFSTAIKEAAITNKQILDVTPVYTLLNQTATIKVVVDGQVNSQMSKNVTIGVGSTLNAPTIEGKKFSYWTVEGIKVSSNETYKFVATVENKEYTIEAVYESESTTITKEPITTITETLVKNGIFEIVAEYDVPEGYTFVEAGIYYSSSQANLDANKTHYSSNITTRSGKIVLDVNASRVNTLYVKSYVVYTDAAGTTHTVYSESTSFSR